MAGDKVNNYSQVDSNILELQLTTDKTFKGYHQLTLTEYDTTTVPAIAAGSAIECNGALYKFDTEEAISTTDPVTSATVADGTVYVCIVPGATTATAAFTATAPTWSDSKQGWYGTGGQANYRYAEYIIVKASTVYDNKCNCSSNFSNRSFVHLMLAGVGSMVISSSDETTIIFDIKNNDILNEYNTSTGYFTAAESGFYYCSGYIEYSNFNSGFGMIRVRKNDDSDLATPWSGRIALVDAAGGASFTYSGYLSKGDTLKITSDMLNDTSYFIGVHSFATFFRVI